LHEQSLDMSYNALTVYIRIDACTQINLDELGSCIDSALGLGGTSFNYASLASDINNLQSGLTSLGVTLTSFLPDPSSFARTAQPGSAYSGPYVSDIIKSFSEYTKTRTDSSGSVFSFETSRFTPMLTRKSFQLCR
jgi:hypothetical protein